MHCKLKTNKSQNETFHDDYSINHIYFVNIESQNEIVYIVIIMMKIEIKIIHEMFSVIHTSSTRNSSLQKARAIKSIWGQKL